MNDGFKQRLVGAIVVVSIGLILWPVIFSEGINPTVDRQSQIVAPPSFDKRPVAKPVRSKAIKPVQSTTTNQVEEAQVVEQQPPDEKLPPDEKQQPTLDSTGLPEAWVLQVASFSQRSNAEELTQALIKQGYKAYNQSINTPEGLSTRVYVGPRYTKSAFKSDKLAIDKAFEVKSMLIRFEQ